MAARWRTPVACSSARTFSTNLMSFLGFLWLAQTWTVWCTVGLTVSVDDAEVVNAASPVSPSPWSTTAVASSSSVSAAAASSAVPRSSLLFSPPTLSLCNAVVSMVPTRIMTRSAAIHCSAASRNLPGNVAEKSSACRFGRMALVMAVSWGSKPSASILSASSRTRYVTCSIDSAPRPRRSSRRPGVAHSTCGAPKVTMLSSCSSLPTPP
mmetsp:Transcript_107635/g.303150  ORF Transcript_107635/g.303150 Transcript_107635/m.303150 type:complete len:210 (+) Transcript_107635:942-1571(+)